MTSDLRHSVPDHPVLAPLTFAHQVGIHIVTTAYCLNLLEEDLVRPQLLTQDSTSAANLSNVSRSLEFFKENAALIDVLLNREPIYLAAQVAGLDEAAVDKDAARIWPLYLGIQTSFSASADKNIALYEALASHVIGKATEQGALRYEIILDGEQL